MTEAEAWKAQVESDYAAARAVWVQDDLKTYCQAIAKYQQVVEKSINFIDAVLREQGLLVGRVRAEHYPERMINRLVRLPQSENKTVAQRLVRIFSRWLPDIYDICALAPKLPPRGEPYQRNTEYPFQCQDGMWTAPADAQFTQAEVSRFERVARQMRAEAEQIAVAAEISTL
jgi:hypothetical protein